MMPAIRMIMDSSQNSHMLDIMAAILLARNSLNLFIMLVYHRL